MKEIVQFCHKTINATVVHITSTEKSFKQNMEKEEIKERISRNEEATK